MHLSPQNLPSRKSEIKMALTNQQIVNNGKRKRNTKKETEKKDVKKPRATKPQQEPDYLEDKRNLALPNQQIVNTGKRKRNTIKETEKKPRATKPQQETEYLEEKRNLEDLWKAAFPVGTELGQLDALYESNWDFKNLEEALEEGGMLYGKKVFVFGIAEPLYDPYKDKILHVPTVVVIESAFPPSDKLAYTSIQSAVEEIIPMKQMKMDWIPYIPFEKRDRQVDRMNFQIFALGCTQRRSALRHLKEDRVRKFKYCLPYIYNPFKEDGLEQSTEVQIMFPSEPPVVCDFDWELDNLEEFVDKLIEEEELSAEQKDEFKEFVKERVRAARKANREAREARRKAIEEMSEDTKEAFQSIKFYKFYPQPLPDVPRFIKSPYINRYYRNAHKVFDMESSEPRNSSSSHSIWNLQK